MTSLVQSLKLLEASIAKGCPLGPENLNWKLPSPSGSEPATSIRIGAFVKRTVTGVLAVRRPWSSSATAVKMKVPMALFVQTSVNGSLSTVANN